MLYLSDVIDKVTAAENIDPNRVYMTGFSLGGTMSYQGRLHPRIEARRNRAGLSRHREPELRAQQARLASSR